VTLTFIVTYGIRHVINIDKKTEKLIRRSVVLKGRTFFTGTVLLDDRSLGEFFAASVYVLTEFPLGVIASHLF